MRQGVLEVVGVLVAMSVVQVASRPAAREWLVAPGREWLRNRLAQRWADGRGPRRLTRRYGSETEYQADVSRLEPLGYREAEHRDFAAERERILRIQDTLPAAVLRGNPPVEPPLPFCIVVWERGPERPAGPA